MRPAWRAGQNESRPWWSRAAQPLLERWRSHKSATCRSGGGQEQRAVRKALMKPIVTAEEMRAAEAEVIAAGTSVETLMERAGTAAAEAIWRFAGPLPALIVC